ncbi:hypothetical protein VTN77DRAFT_9347 [Rasamsonia byssochlamydoides]|uniref:uncharacterized protein n=1 Tax=Rasamsonia byssochlamydoides TaxID=89139 RepID=UPI0037421BE5
MVDICRLISDPSPPVSPRTTSTSNYTSITFWRSREDNMTFLSSAPPFSTVDPETHGEATQPETDLSAFKSQENIPFSSNLGHQEYLQSLKSVPEEKQIKRHTTGETCNKKRLRAWNRSDPNIAITSKSDSPSPGLQKTSHSNGENELDALGEENYEEGAEVISPVDEADAFPENGQNGQTKSTSEQGSEKKKAKRFRLTHNQTRFLMSEFTRQAHPDAAHRERLSKEIPGLTPRQVQVWFQNRRAKLKRLTSQDRERMLKSRALPDNFDMAQVLHQPYGGRTTSGTPLPSPRTDRSSFASNGDSKPLVVNTVKRPSGDDYPISPSSTTSAYGNYVTSLTSGAPSDNLSPTSPTSNRTPISAPSASLPVANHRTPSTLPRSHSFSAAYSHGWHPLQRLHLPTSDSRSRAESLSSPLRPRLPYTGGTLHENVGSPVPGIAQPLQSPVSRAGSDTTSIQSGMIYPNEQLPASQALPFPRIQQLSDDSRAGFPLGPSYRQIPTTLQTAQLPLSQDYQFSPYTPPFNLDSFYPYAQDNSSSMSLPVSYLRSETEHDSPSTFHYPAENELEKSSVAHPPVTR